MLTSFLVTFPIGAGWAIQCNQITRSAENAEKHARNELKAVFPEWAPVVEHVAADVQEVEVICKEAV